LAEVQNLFRLICDAGFTVTFLCPYFVLVMTSWMTATGSSRDILQRGRCSRQPCSWGGSFGRGGSGELTLQWRSRHFSCLCFGRYGKSHVSSIFISFLCGQRLHKHGPNPSKACHSLNVCELPISESHDTEMNVQLSVTAENDCKQFSNGHKKHPIFNNVCLQAS